MEDLHEKRMADGMQGCCNVDAFVIAFALDDQHEDRAWKTD